MREITCQRCGTKFTADADFPAIVRCPQCQSEFAVPPAPLSDPGAKSGGLKVLPYRPPQSPNFLAGPFMAGFFGTMGFTVIVFVILAALTITSDGMPPANPYPGMIARGFLVALIAVAYFGIGVKARQLSRDPRWAGIGRGVIVALCLSLLVMTPCAGIFITGFSV